MNVSLSLDRLVEKIRCHSDFDKVGMIACHLGVVRGSSRQGQPVKRMEVRVNQKVIREIIDEAKREPGIIEILVEVQGGVLRVGESVMAVAVAGDFREHVFPVLERVVNLIKQKAVLKKEE
ncbi:MAG: molybdenum cofactor biosynthesis protein MoaE [Candidatus Desulfofervidaceae bacterium]|nr:molybdenum cofactor biosynthesis protein MoaE [Candidatus Desulfofervidaceae bacterium]